MRPAYWCLLAALPFGGSVVVTPSCNKSGIVVPLGGSSSVGVGGSSGVAGVTIPGDTETTARGGASAGTAGVAGSGAALVRGAAGSAGAVGGGTTNGGSTLGTSQPPQTLPPPKQCGNQFYVPGCVRGDTTTTCGGNCVNFANACGESAANKGSVATAFACPQWMLFSEAMKQAAIADGNTAFNYAVVAHEVDNGGVDGGAQTACCQCYQLVFSYPNSADRTAWVNPDDANDAQSGIVPVPPPLIVQSFNTGVTPESFHVLMAAGGFGTNNACDPNAQMKSVSGMYFYSSFPVDGADNGGVKAASKYPECKTSAGLVTTASLSTVACQSRVQTECNKIINNSPSITADSVRSCVQSNNAQTYYHLNWNVYVMKVECPVHLTDLTGCKLAPQGLPSVNRDITTAAQAAASTAFRARAANGASYHTSTVQDCCMPSCAAQDWVIGKGLKALGSYNSFYSCTQAGTPITE